MKMEMDLSVSWTCKEYWLNLARRLKSKPVERESCAISEPLRMINSQKVWGVEQLSPQLSQVAPILPRKSILKVEGMLLVMFCT